MEGVLLTIFLGLNTIAFAPSSEGKEYIPTTTILEDTPYQIGQFGKPGFMTSADIVTNSGSIFVQMDDHADRKSKYAAGEQFYEDSLWTFKRLDDTDFDNPFVTIHHVKHPGYLLVHDAARENPGAGAPVKTYLILSKDLWYKDEESSVRKYAKWSVETGTQSGLDLKNLGSGKLFAVLPRSGNEFYQWIAETDEEDSDYYAFTI